MNLIIVQLIPTSVNIKRKYHLELTNSETGRTSVISIMAHSLYYTYNLIRLIMKFGGNFVAVAV